MIHIYIYIIALYYYNYLVDPTEATPGCRTTSHGRPQTMTSTKVSAPPARWKPWFSHGKRVFFPMENDAFVGLDLGKRVISP